MLLALLPFALCMAIGIWLLSYGVGVYLYACSVSLLLSLLLLLLLLLFLLLLALYSRHNRSIVPIIVLLSVVASLSLSLCLCMGVSVCVCVCVCPATDFSLRLQCSRHRSGVRGCCSVRCGIKCYVRHATTNGPPLCLSASTRFCCPIFFVSRFTCVVLFCLNEKLLSAVE